MSGISNIQHYCGCIDPVKGELYPEFCERCRGRIQRKTMPTQQEQSAIDRALWSEIGLAIGRIELKLRNMADDRDKDHQLYRQMDERLWTIETCQEKHRLALESITRILEKITGIAQPKRKRERKGKR